jgi:hypothetical protein
MLVVSCERSARIGHWFPFLEYAGRQTVALTPAFLGKVTTRQESPVCIKVGHRA